jgi:hypothetical protein
MSIKLKPGTKKLIGTIFIAVVSVVSGILLNKFGEVPVLASSIFSISEFLLAEFGLITDTKKEVN